MLLEDCRPQNNFARSPLKGSLFSILMHASCPTTMEKQEAAISLKKIFHSERGDIDITLDFKGGPRIYFVPEVYEDLSDYIMDLLREIMAIQSESELSQPTKAYQQAVKSMQLHKNGFTDNSVTGSTANSKHPQLLTDAKNAGSYASPIKETKQTPLTLLNFYSNCGQVAGALSNC